MNLIHSDCIHLCTQNMYRKYHTQHASDTCHIYVYYNTIIVCVYVCVILWCIYTYILVLPPGNAKFKGAPFRLEGLDLEVVVAVRHQLLNNLCILPISCVVIANLDHLGPVVGAEKGHNDITVTVSQNSVLGPWVLVGVEANEEFCTCS